jgi:Zn-dependent protease
MSNPADKLAVVLVTSIIPMILSLSLHEWAHAVTAVALGDDTPREQGRLTLNPVAHMTLVGTLLLPTLLAFFGLPVFGWAKPVVFSPPRLTRRISMATGVMITAAAGPVMNLLIAIAAALLIAGWHHFGTPVDPRYLLLAGSVQYMNVMLFIVNLLPIYPLDGSSVLFGLLPSAARGSYIQLQRWSPVLLIVLLLAGGQYIRGPADAVALGLRNFAQVVFPVS